MGFITQLLETNNSSGTFRCSHTLSEIITKKKEDTFTLVLTSSFGEWKTEMHEKFESFDPFLHEGVSIWNVIHPHQGQITIRHSFFHVNSDQGIFHAQFKIS